MLIGVGSTWATVVDNGDCGTTGHESDVTWTLTSDGVMTISGSGAMADYTSAFNQPWKTNRNSITSIVVAEGVTHIGNSAFRTCYNATSVSLPSTLISIGQYAFYACNNASLTSITIPANVTSIGANAFQSCSSLTSVTIPNKVTSIGNSAFNGCSGLTSVSIPNSVTSIGTQAFYGCSGLTAVNIPSGVTSLEKNVFGGCSGLTTLTIGSGVTTIGESAFYGCSGLTSVTIPNNVETIGDNAFNGCSGLQSLTIGSSVTSIGTNVFSGCSNLSAFNVADGNTVYSSDGGVLFNVDKTTIFQYPVGKSGDSYDIPASVTSIGVYAFSGCANLTAVNIPSGVTSIGDYAFNNCSGLTSVTIPDNVLTIGTYTFYHCSGLTEVVIPDKVTSIGQSAFFYCTGLTSVTIGSAVTSIGLSGFRNCTSLTTVTVKAEECALGNSAFAYCDNLAAIYVPSGRVEYYKGATNWSAYSGIISAPPVDLTLDEATDNSTTLSENNGKTANVTLTRTLQTGGWNTFCVPFNLTIPDGWTVKELSTSSFVSSNGELTLNFETATSIVAGKPYLVMVTSNLINPTFKGVTINNTDGTVSTVAVDFVPVMGQTQVTADPANVLFLASGNKLKNPSAANQSIKGFRAYFLLKGDAAAATRAFSLNFGNGETTGIMPIVTRQKAADEAIYDLQGRRVDGAIRKGVYIKNGKKTIIK